MNTISKITRDVFCSVLEKKNNDYLIYINNSFVYKKNNNPEIYDLNVLKNEINRIEATCFLSYKLNQLTYNEGLLTTDTSITLYFLLGGIYNFNISFVFNKMNKITNIKIIALDSMTIENYNIKLNDIIALDYDCIQMLYDYAFIVDFKNDLCINIRTKNQFKFSKSIQGSFRNTINKEKEQFIKLLDVSNYTKQENGKIIFDREKLPKGNKIEFTYTNDINKTTMIISATLIFIYSKIIDDYYGVYLLKDITKDIKQYNQNVVSLVHKLDSNMNMLSHDLKNLVNNIMGYSTLLELTLDDKDKANNYLSGIKKSTEYINKLITSILKYSELESGNLKVERVEFDVLALLKDIIALNELEANKKSITLNLEENNLFYSIIYTDPIKLKQIIMNLVSNAIKYTVKGGVTIRVEEKRIDKSYYNLIISVIDTGIGIENDFLDKLYKPFCHDKHDEGSTGLGLCITENLVKLLRGEITVDSTINKGTIFTVTIPLINTLNISK